MNAEASKSNGRNKVKVVMHYKLQHSHNETLDDGGLLL